MDLLIAANTVTQPNSDIAPATGTPGWATDGDPTTNTQATQAPAWHYNMMMAEMLAIVKAAGITPSNADWSQVLKAMQTIFASAQRGVAPYSATLAQLIGGYPKYAIVVDATGTFWVSQSDENMTVPDADAANWKSLFDGSVTQEWANSQFLKTSDTATQKVTGPVTFSGITMVPTPTDYSQNQAVGASDADGRYGGLNGDNLWTGTQLIQSWVACDQLYVNNSAQKMWLAAYIDPKGYATVDLNGGISTASTGNLGWLRFDVPGRILTPKGTVAFISDFSANLAQNGYQKLASGLIVQWGVLTINGSGIYDLPIEFPNNFFIVQAADVGSGLLSYGAFPASKSTFNLYTNHSDQVNCSFFAIGN